MKNTSRRKSRFLKSRIHIIKAYSRILLLVISFMVSMNNLSAQSFEWIDAVPIDFVSNPSGITSSVCLDQNENIYFAGLQSQISGVRGNIFIRKYDNAFNLLDEISLLGEASVFATKCDGDGNLLVSLITSSEIIFPNSEDTIHYLGGYSNSVFLKMNGSMILDWFITKDYNSAGFSGIEIATDPGNNIYLGNSTMQSASFITKYNSEGTLIFEIGQDNVGRVSSVSIDNEGNIYSAGSCVESDAVFGGVPFNPGFVYNLYLAKYNDLGEVQWVKFVEDISCLDPEVMVTDPDYIYLSGPLGFPMLFDTIQTNGPSWVYDFYLARLNANGDFLWVKEVPEVDGGDAALWANDYLCTDDQHNIYVSGFIRGDIDWGNGIVTNSTNNYYDFLALKYDSNGELIHAKSAGGEGYDASTTSVVDATGNCYFSGTGHGTITLDSITVTPSEGIYSFIVKVGADIQTDVFKNNRKPQFTIFPNPATSTITIENTGSEIQSIEILSAFGKRVDQFSKEQNQLDISNFPNGIYFLKIKTENDTFVKKLIIE